MTSTDDTPVPDYANMLRLDGRRIVVLGAGQGIGRQTSHALAANGARTFCVDVDEGLANEIAEETGGIAWSGDATDRASMERLFADAEQQLGGVDGVVDIIGISRYHDLVDASDEEWDWAALVRRWSLGWCTARVDGELVGFVNVLTDGLVHAWLQDVMVSPLHRRLGIGRRLVALAVEQCRDAGCEWLHVDYDDDAIEFYERTCGFQPTNGGLRSLR